MADLIYAENFTGNEDDPWPAIWTVNQYSGNAGSVYQDGNGNGAIELDGADSVAQWLVLLDDSGQPQQEATTRFLVGTGGNRWWGIALRSNGTQNNVYRARYSVADAEIQITRTASGSTTTMGTAAGPNASTAQGFDWSIRAQTIPEGSNLRVRMRMWLSTDAEPGTWGIDEVDTSPLAVGSAGIYNLASVQGTTNLYRHYELYNLDTGPKTNFFIFENSTLTPVYLLGIGDAQDEIDELHFLHYEEEDEEEPPPPTGDGHLRLDGDENPPAGWTFTQGGFTGATYAFGEMTIPDSQFAESIHAGKTTDDSARIECECENPQEGIDFAFMLGSDVSGTPGWAINILLEGSGNDAIRNAFYTTETWGLNIFSFSRIGANTTTHANASYSSFGLNMNEGHAGWFRIRLVDGTLTYSHSKDGATWHTIQSYSTALATERVAIGISQTGASSPGGTFRIAKIVDMLETEGIARDPAPWGEVPSPTVMTEDLELIGTATVDGSAIELSTVMNVDGSHGWVRPRWKFADGGILVRVSSTTSYPAFWLVGLRQEGDTAHADQYGDGRSWLIELVTNNETRRMIRTESIHPVDTNPDFERPYTFIGQDNGGMRLVNPKWIRIEAYGEFVRAKMWDDAVSEPSTWDFDIQDAIWTDEGRPWVALSHNDGETTNDTAEVTVEFIEVYAYGDFDHVPDPE